MAPVKRSQLVFSPEEIAEARVAVISRLLKQVTDMHLKPGESLLVTMTVLVPDNEGEAF